LCSRALKCACDATPRAPFFLFRHPAPPQTATAEDWDRSAR
jgi:hypothetical protein